MPDSLMAVTFIAIGTSIPDAYTSVIVVKQGMVDMGVSNIIGSNEEYEKYSEGMSDDDIAKWKEGFVVGANFLLKNKNEKNI